MKTQICNSVSAMTPILTTKGWYAAKDLKVGHQVYDRKGRTCRILYINKKKRMCYRLYFNDNSYIDVGAKQEVFIKKESTRKTDVYRNNKIEDYIGFAKMKAKDAQLPWEYLVNPRIHKYRDKLDILKTEKAKFIAEHIYYKDEGIYCYNTPMGKPRFFPEQELKIDPYVLGVWHVAGQNAEPVINIRRRKHILTELDRLGYKYTPFKRYVGYYFRNHFYINSLVTGLKYYNLLKNKYIPREYLFSTEEQRFRFLSGIVDARGYVNKNKYTIYITSPLVASQIILMIRSLGIVCDTKIIKRRPLEIRGKIIHRRDLCRIRFNVPFKIGTNPYRPEYQDKHDHRWRKRNIIGGKCLGGTKEMIGLVVDSPDHSFLAGSSYVALKDNFEYVNKELLDYGNS